VRCWLLAVLLLTGCTTYNVRAPVGDRTAGPAHNPDTHLVRRGDTLYSIAFQYGYSIEEVARWNDLGPPYTIYRGQELRLVPRNRQVSRPPPPASRPKARAPVRTSLATVGVSQPKFQSLPKTSASLPRNAARVVAPPTVATVAPVQVPAASAQSQTPAASPAASASIEFETPAEDGPLTWAWPASGALIRGYHPDKTGKKGIYIAGGEGEEVHAAAPGKVVYSGSGLSGYGRLIIIKHNNDFLSAYAHNRKLIATEGQWVDKGDVIAQMGSSDTDRTQLHFEIRKHGRPVDPLRFLPSRQDVRVVGEKQ
jgi:lipoprotein NlpD